MKKIFILATFILLAFAPQAAKGYAEASFEKKEHDFGYINETAGPVKCEFKFTNTGNKPLLIIDAVPSCGCTRPEYPKRPIAPGDTGIIKVEYQPLGRTGAFKKDIRVNTNGKEKKVILYIIGVTIPGKK